MVLAEEWSPACGANTLSPCTLLFRSIGRVRTAKTTSPGPRWLLAIPPVECTIPTNTEASFDILGSLNLIEKRLLCLKQIKTTLPLCTWHCTLCIVQCTLHCIAYIAYIALYTLHWTFHTVYVALYTLRYCLRSVYGIVVNAHADMQTCRFGRRRSPMALDHNAGPMNLGKQSGAASRNRRLASVFSENVSRSMSRSRFEVEIEVEVEMSKDNNGCKFSGKKKWRVPLFRRMFQGLGS